MIKVDVTRAKVYSRVRLPILRLYRRKPTLILYVKLGIVVDT